MSGYARCRPGRASRAKYLLPDGSEFVWESRRHRKGRGPRRSTGQVEAGADRARQVGKRVPWIGWSPRRMAWWISVLFTVGSVLFVLGAAASLSPGVFSGSESAALLTDTTYFTGALLYTAGIYLQVLEALNCSDRIGLSKLHRSSHGGFAWFAWRPRRLEFMGPFVLLVGSLLYNAQTSLALASSLGLAELPLLGQVGNLSGGVLFVVSTYMQLAEVCHRAVCLRTREVSWWVAALFVAGSVGFVLGAVFGFELPGLSSAAASSLGALFFLAGSALFLADSYLLLPEMYPE